jgi:class 3 adenylate cyclase/pimeloyl-ACP methyl ester carboxylesterase
MEPRVQYGQTSDGVSIAFWTLGEGPPLIQMPSAPISPSLRAWQTPEGRRWYEGLANGRMLIRYDNRGCGDSQRDAIDYSLDASILDMEAAVDKLKLERFVLFGYLGSTTTAIAYAARHPEHVSRLLLWCGSSRGLGFFNTRMGAMDTLRDTDFEFFTETVALSWFGWSAAEQARRYAAALRENTTPEAMRATAEEGRNTDVTDLLPQVSMPTLVMHRRDLRLPPLDSSRELAAHIPNARLVVFDGEAGVPYVGDFGPALEAIDAFLAEEPAPSSAAPVAPSGLITILFTDMESSTALTQRLGDAAAQELVRVHNTIVRDALKAHEGSEIKHTGDGIMASFALASGALDCAITIQRAVALRQAQGGDIESLGVHIGVNAGEPVAEEQDLFGTSVQLARRICDHADGAEILVSNVVRELTAGKGFLFADRGDTALRGYEDPVRLWELRWRDA